MLPWVFSLLAEHVALRAVLAGGGSLLIGMLLGPWWIARLKRSCGDPIVSPSPEIERLHQGKQATPTMGGLFLLTGVVGSLLLCGDLSNGYLQVGILLTLGLMLLGAVDDLAKLRSRRRGITARSKFFWQVVLAGVAAVLLYRLQAGTPGGLDLRTPLLGMQWELGWAFIPLAMLVMVGSSNAVNLTDGLDGLAGGCLVFATTAVGIVAYYASLDASAAPGAAEAVVLAGGILGGLLAFLWFNCHPAQVFMGDTGALPLGGLLGFLAVACRQELLLILIGGVFVVEAASVILQIGSFRLRGRRIFRCAPLHHHFQFAGWPEPRIVVRFWIAGALCAVLGVACTKLTLHDRPAASNLSRAVSTR